MPIPSTITELRDVEKQRALRLLRSLPSLKPDDTKNGDICCPICLISFESIHEDELLICRRDDLSHPSSSSQPEGPEEMYGVVKLNICGHVFCRRDLAEWIESFHGSCPTCRQDFFEFTPVNEADYESSDGGEYLPDEHELEEDELLDVELDFMPSSDFYTDAEMEDIDTDGDEEAEVSFSLEDEQHDPEAHWDSSSVYADVTDDELEDDDVDDMPELEVPSDRGIPELDSGASSENDSASMFGGVTTDSSNPEGSILRIREAESSEHIPYSTDLIIVSSEGSKQNVSQGMPSDAPSGSTPI